MPRRGTKAFAWAVPIAAEIAALLRSVILARLIGAEELGQAMILALVLRLTEMISDVGIERLLAQARDGDTPEFQASLQAAVLLRGLVMALGMCALAWPMAHLFGSGPSTLAYAAMGSVPLVRAFLHLDYRRRERHFDYTGLAVVELSATLTMLVVSGLAAYWVQDHRALIWAVMGHAVVQVVASHLVADRPYRVDFKIKELLRIWRFGAPLIVNAALMFITMQADRLIVAAHMAGPMWRFTASRCSFRCCPRKLLVGQEIRFGRLSSASRSKRGIWPQRQGAL